MAKRRSRRRRAPARRRARRRNPSPPRRAPRRRRRRNPSRTGGTIGAQLSRQVKGWAPRFLGKLWVAWLVRRWGGRGQLFGGDVVQSYTAGASLSFGQYILGAIGVHVGAMVFGSFKFINKAEFLDGGYDYLLTKLVWTEGFARNGWAKQQFGNVRYSPGSGQTWVQQGDQWAAMQGAMGDALVEASPLDGELVEASPLDGTGSYTYGHLMSSSATAEQKRLGKWGGTGYVNPWAASYAS